MGHGAFIGRGENYKGLVIKRGKKTQHGTCRLGGIIVGENVRIYLTAGTRCELL
jgi:hypothetical protein